MHKKVKTKPMLKESNLRQNRMTKKEREYMDIFENGDFPPKHGMRMIFKAAREGRLEYSGKNPVYTRMQNEVKKLKEGIDAKKARIRARAKAKKKARA